MAQMLVRNLDDDPVGDLLARLGSSESREEPVIPEDPADHSAADFG
ncbi:hypothetical protein BKA15_000898 [Microlunatus parietis]|uniref:Uncharacterized protein n=1 Tax=Microlunatus parietis TaxID=682979 RepID=A0A7Y9L7A2_9ACTN|nr:hypothetical protein [Microlunatus parietis]NYE69569.1 hypothetical protein [Microlunatus parietis]